MSYCLQFSKWPRHKRQNCLHKLRTQTKGTAPGRVKDTRQFTTTAAAATTTTTTTTTAINTAKETETYLLQRASKWESLALVRQKRTHRMTWIAPVLTWQIRKFFETSTKRHKRSSLKFHYSHSLPRAWGDLNQKKDMAAILLLHPNAAHPVEMWNQPVLPAKNGGCSQLILAFLGIGGELLDLGRVWYFTLEGNMVYLKTTQMKRKIIWSIHLHECANTSKNVNRGHPPEPSTPPRISRPYFRGLMKGWFPLIRAN